MKLPLLALALVSGLKDFKDLRTAAMNSVRRLTVRKYVPKRPLVKTSKPRSGLQEYSLKNFKIFLALELDGPSDPIT